MQQSETLKGLDRLYELYGVFTPLYICNIKQSEEEVVLRSPTILGLGPRPSTVFSSLKIWSRASFQCEIQANVTPHHISRAAGILSMGFRDLALDLETVFTDRLSPNRPHQFYIPSLISPCVAAPANTCGVLRER